MQVFMTSETCQMLDASKVCQTDAPHVTGKMTGTVCKRKTHVQVKLI